MRFTILRNLREPGWIATEQAVRRIPCRGVGDIPTEALQDLLLQMWERGDRSPELLAMIDAENDAALLRNEP